MAKPKTKEAKVEIVLPDGTKISARGPMAEQMARRLMDAPRYYYPGTWYTPTLYTAGTTFGATTASLTVTRPDGTTEAIDPAAVESTITSAFSQ